MSARILLLGLALAALGACTEHEPYHREGEWQPEGINAGNMAAMAANPLDLVRGHGASGSAHRTAANAVDRLWDPATAAPAATGPAAGQAQSAAPASSKPTGN
jgi:type IV pilus biogenesis protein CpaD/CtpE